MRTPHRRIRSRLEEGERAFGVTVMLPCPEIVEIAGYAGLDYVWIDAEHGTLGIADIAELVRAADAVGIDAIVRVPDHTPSFIQRVLDIGAAGIIVPHIRTLAEASSMVAAAKFAPEGTRGACPSTRAVGHLSDDWPTDARRANEDVLVIGLIEDIEGVENVEAIASESGLHALLFGPFDLSVALGLEGDITHPDLEQMHRRVVAAVRAAGIEYLALQGWEFGGYASMLENSRIINVSGDRGGLLMMFRGARAAMLKGLAKAGAEA